MKICTMNRVRIVEVAFFADRAVMKSIQTIQLKIWAELQELAVKWKDLDKFGNAYYVDWASGSNDKLWHKNCKVSSFST